MYVFCKCSALFTYVYVNTNLYVHVLDFFVALLSDTFFDSSTVSGSSYSSERDKSPPSLLSNIDTTSLHILFFHLVDQIRELLQQHDYDQLLTQCREMKASEDHGLNLFSEKQLAKCDNVPSLLRWLCYHFIWCDHSILRELSNCSKEAIKFLDEFDCKLDCMKPIASYPIPYFSCDMIPTNPTSTHTVLAIRCDQELYNCTLQYVYDMKSVMVEKCDITLHCLQLLAVRPNPTIIYWTIPKCVVELISSKVPVHSEYLYSRGVLEVLLYPEPLLATSDDARTGSLAFRAIHEDIMVCMYIKLCKNSGPRNKDWGPMGTQHFILNILLCIYAFHTVLETSHVDGQSTFSLPQCLTQPVHSWRDFLVNFRLH